MNFKLEVEKLSCKHVPPKRSLFGLCKLTNDTIAIFGGFAGHHGYYNDFWMLTGIKTGKYKWIEIKEINDWPSERRGNTLNYYNKNIYLFGGKNSYRYFNDLWKYNIKSQQWTEVYTPDFIPETEKHTSVVYKHYIIYFGGRDWNKTYNSLFIFNCNNSTWKEEFAPNAPISRYNHAMCLVGDILIVHGGLDIMDSITNEFSHIYSINIDYVLNNRQTKWKKIMTNMDVMSRHVMICDNNSIYSIWDNEDTDNDKCINVSGYILTRKLIEKYCAKNSKLFVHDVIIDEITKYMGNDIYINDCIEVRCTDINKMWYHKACMIYIKKVGYIFIFGGEGGKYYDDSYLVRLKQNSNIGNKKSVTF